MLGSATVTVVAAAVFQAVGTAGIYDGPDDAAIFFAVGLASLRMLVVCSCCEVSSCCNDVYG